jgi:hypothetical protein
VTAQAAVVTLQVMEIADETDERGRVSRRAPKTNAPTRNEQTIERANKHKPPEALRLSKRAAHGRARRSVHSDEVKLRLPPLTKRQHTEVEQVPPPPLPLPPLPLLPPSCPHRPHRPLHLLLAWPLRVSHSRRCAAVRS